MLLPRSKQREKQAGPTLSGKPVHFSTVEESQGQETEGTLPGYTLEQSDSCTGGLNPTCFK